MIRRDNCLRRPAQVDLTHSACPSALCPHRTAGVDVHLTFVAGPLAVLFGIGSTLRRAAASSAIASETRENQPLNDSRALGAGSPARLLQTVLQAVERQIERTRQPVVAQRI
jgi:hypothetical protein